MGTLLKGPGGTLDVPPEQVDRYLAEGYTPVGAQERAATVSREALDARANERGVLGAVNAGATSFLSGATLGASDALLSTLMDRGERERLRLEREANPGISTAANIAGAVAPALLSGGTSTAASVARLTPAGLASRAGSAIAHTAEGAGLATKVGRAVAGGAVEGGLQGIGEGISELALDERPITAERIGSTLSSRMLFGGVVGGAAGGLGKVAEIGLTKARAALDDVAATGALRARAAAEADDLANLDVKGLGAARKTQFDTFKAAEKAELEAIEAARVPQRTQLADDLAAFRREVKEQNHAITTMNLKLPAAEGKWATSEIGKVAKDANKTIDRLLNDPTGLATKASARETMATALRVQENAWEQTLKRSDDLRAAFAADTSGTRMAALDSIPGALEKNRALQARIADLATPPTSPKLAQLGEAHAARLAAIDEAKDAFIANAARPKSLAEQAASGAVYSGAAGLAGAIPFVGPAIAPFIGAKAAGFVGEKVFGRLAKAGQEAAARTAKALGAFVDVTRKVTPVAPVVATKVLSHVAFRPDADDEPPKGRDQLATLFHRRSEEVRSLVSTGPDGKAVARPEVRQAVADHLTGIGVVNPVLADHIETVAARRVEFLADKMPRRPDMAGMPIGPDRWRPSDMEMRQWARYVAAVEDPYATMERLVGGTLTPEDAEVMRTVYPEMLADLTTQIITSLATLRTSLPYHRKIALSILTGVAVDPAMDPRVLGKLQATFADEPGTEGGIAPPKAAPQFGSLKAEKSTPAQGRVQGVA